MTGFSVRDTLSVCTCVPAQKHKMAQIGGILQKLPENRCLLCLSMIDEIRAEWYNIYYEILSVSGEKTFLADRTGTGKKRFHVYIRPL